MLNIALLRLQFNCNDEKTVTLTVNKIKISLPFHRGESFVKEQP